jgi:hypothetical protein
VANVNSPNGFQFFGKREGASPTVGLTPRKIAAADTTPIGYGDPVTSLATGYVTRSTAGIIQIAGIFYGCKYFNSAVGRTVWSKSWPGAGNTGDIEAFLDTDPNSLYVAQSNGAAITFADINANINFAIGTPQTEAAGGFSTSSLNQATLGTTATLPFRIIGLLSEYTPPGSVNGTDDASTFNRVIVAMNFNDRTSTTGMLV